MSLGWNTCEHKEEVAAAEKHCIEVALAHGVQPRVEIYHVEDAERYKEMGVKHFCIGDEFDILKDYWTNVGAAMKKSAMEMTARKSKRQKKKCKKYSYFRIRQKRLGFIRNNSRLFLLFIS